MVRQGSDHYQTIEASRVSKNAQRRASCLDETERDHEDRAPARVGAGAAAAKAVAAWVAAVAVAWGEVDGPAAAAAVVSGRGSGSVARGVL
jgi:hypothetical protein